MEIKQQKAGNIRYSMVSFHPKKDKVVFEKEGEGSWRINDIVISGQFDMGSVSDEDTVFVLKDGDPLIESVKAFKKADVPVIFKATPELLRDGEVRILYSQVPDEMIDKPQSQMGVGHDKEGNVFIVLTEEHVTLKQLAQIMKLVGCDRAIAVYGNRLVEKKLEKKEKKSKDKGRDKNERVLGD